MTMNFNYTVKGLKIAIKIFAGGSQINMYFVNAKFAVGTFLFMF